MTKNKVAADLPVKRMVFLNEGHLLIDFDISAYADIRILPGQFVQVEAAQSISTFLRIPLSVHDVDPGTQILSLLVKILGDGTRGLAKIKPGESVNVIFPLGNAFTIPADKHKPVLLVGGGCGVAPLMYLAKTLIANGINCRIAIGASNARNILRVDDYKAIAPVEVASDDGSTGIKGLVTSLPCFNNLDQYQAVYACGPDGMMKAVSTLAAEKNVYCEVSLENYMACGIGACLCCVAATDKGNLRTCVEGPVFDASTLKNWTKTVCNG